MFPILFEFPNFWPGKGDPISGTGQLIVTVIGVGASLVWLSCALRGKKGVVSQVCSWIAFLFGAYLVVSLIMEGTITIFTFSVMILLGFLVCTWYVLRQTRPLKLKDTRVFDFAMWMLLIGIAGSRILYALLNWDEFRDEPGKVVMIWHGGLVWYGGFIPAAIAGFFLLERFKLPGLVFADIAAAAVMLGLAIGRWGCLCAGDDYGQATDLPWGIKFFHPRALVAPGFKTGEGVALHPTQIYMSLNCVWLFFLLDWIRRRARYAGMSFAWLIILYALTRAVLIEPFRGDFAERNPNLESYAAVQISIDRGEGGPEVHLERGDDVSGSDRPWSGGLIDGIELAGSERAGTVWAMTRGPVPDAKRLRKEGQLWWDIDRIEGLPRGVEVRAVRTTWYSSDLGVPVGYVSTSQWISVPMLLIGILLLVWFRRLRAPGYADASREAERADAADAAPPS